MYCSNCGIEISDTDKYCSKCGASNKNYSEPNIDFNVNKSKNENLVQKKITITKMETTKIKKKLKGLFALFIYCNLFLLPLKVVAIFLQTEIVVTGNILFDVFNIIYSLIIFFACIFVVIRDENIQIIGVRIIKCCLILDLFSYLLFIVFDLKYQEIDFVQKILKVCIVLNPIFWITYFWNSKNVRSYIGK